MDSSTNLYAITVTFDPQAGPRDQTSLAKKIQDAANAVWQQHGQTPANAYECGPYQLQGNPQFNTLAIVKLPRSQTASWQLEAALRQQQINGHVNVSQAIFAEDHVGAVEELLGSTR
jgi:hypothetical protein